jgi:putative ABC transport system substrate-binding protein
VTRASALALVVLAALATPLVVGCAGGTKVEPTGRGAVHQIGVLGAAPASSQAALARGFERGLRELGYLESQNASIEYAWTDGTLGAFRERAGRLVARKVDVIVTGSNGALTAAMEATRTIPIVMAISSGDPVALGFVKSVQRPGGNVTGLSDSRYRVALAGGVISVEDSTHTLLELLKAAVPNASRVAILLNSDNPFHSAYWQEIQARAGALGLTLSAAHASRVTDLAPAVESMARARAHGFVVPPDLLFSLHRRPIADAARAHRLPAISSDLDFALDGGLLSYGLDGAANFRRAATYVDQILRGASPADLALQSATDFRFFINLKTALAFVLPIPPHVLLRADRLIE